MSVLSDKNRERAEKTLLKSITIACIKCHGPMVRVHDLYDQALVGYSCKNCPHYYLLNNNPI